MHCFKGKKLLLFFFSKITVSWNKFKFHFIHVFSGNIFKILCCIHDLQKNVPQISLETPSPLGRALLIKSIYVSLDGHQFLYSLVRFPPVHSLFIYSICLFIYIIIIFSPKLRNMEFFF